MTRKRGLGRGLESLLNHDFDATGAADDTGLQELALDTLMPGRYQPRRDMDEQALESLAQSIRAQGILQPLVVRAADDGYEIIAGERRWRAARRAGLDTVPVVVREITDETAMAVALIENIQREDLNPLEEAAALRRLIEECGMTHAACAEAVGRSRASVSNLLRLSELAPEAQALLRAGQIDMGHARALLGAPPEAQAGLAARVADKGLTVRQTEALVQAELNGERPVRQPPQATARMQELEGTLADVLGTRVHIKAVRGGKTRVVIDYDRTESLEQLIKRLDSRKN